MLLSVTIQIWFYNDEKQYFCLTCHGKRGQAVDKGSQIGYSCLQNIFNFPFVFVAELYFNKGAHELGVPSSPLYDDEIADAGEG